MFMPSCTILTLLIPSIPPAFPERTYHEKQTSFGAGLKVSDEQGGTCGAPRSAGIVIGRLLVLCIRVLAKRIYPGVTVRLGPRPNVPYHRPPSCQPSTVPPFEPSSLLDTPEPPSLR
jgi:hypothetical protein